MGPYPEGQGGNPTAICSIDFPVQSEVVYTINSIHIIDFNESDGTEMYQCGTSYAYMICNVWSDPEGFMALPLKYGPSFSTLGSSIVQEITGSMTGTGVSQIFPDVAEVLNPTPPIYSFGAIWQIASTSAKYPGCSVPTISSVSPDGWWASQPANITINGGCFLTSSDKKGPSKVTLTDGANEVRLSNVSVVSSSQITATVNVTKKTPAETVTLTVTNPPGSDTPGSGTANPSPVVLPIPVIKWLGKTISGDKAKNQSVIVGQPVELTTTPATLPCGFTVSKSTWTVDGDNIGGYHGTDAGIRLDDTLLKDTKTTFYWLYPDTGLNVKYEYCATDPSGTEMCTSPQAKATFRATRPAISMSTWDSDEVSIENLNVCDDSRTVNGTAPWLGYGNLYYPPRRCTGTFDGTPGIRLRASGGSDGKYLFAQIINSDSRNYTNSNGGIISCGPTSGLDKHYPFPGVYQNSPSIAYDGPQIPLMNNYISASRSFNATMYLLWQPDQLSGTATKSIPVPIGYQIWQFGATADGVQGRREWRWRDPTFTPSNAHGGIDGFMHSTSGDPNTWDGYPQWDNITSTGCNN